MLNGKSQLKQKRNYKIILMNELTLKLEEDKQDDMNKNIPIHRSLLQHQPGVLDRVESIGRVTVHLCDC